jgi:hypothetical protein
MNRYEERNEPKQNGSIFKKIDLFLKANKQRSRMM